MGDGSLGKTKQSKAFEEYVNEVIGGLRENGNRGTSCIRER